VFGNRNPESDVSLRRIERDSVVACVAMPARAVVFERGGLGGALGVAGGGALMAFSYRAIRAGVDAMVYRADLAGSAAPPPHGRSGVMWPTARFILRYAVVGMAAWVLLVPLHANPVGIIAGVTAPVVALAIEAVRLQRRG
jgi:hypothetical protein